MSPEAEQRIVAELGRIRVVLESRRQVSSGTIGVGILRGAIGIAALVAVLWAAREVLTALAA